MCCGTYSPLGRLLGALLLILAGGALLLHNLGLWQWPIWQLWPLWIIGAGLIMLFDRRPHYRQGYGKLEGGDHHE